MAISVRNACTLVALFLMASVASADALANECGVSFDLPTTMQVRRDTNVQTPLCSLVDTGNQPTPFVNAITVVPWARLNDLRVNGEALRDIGFFRLARPSSVTYLGRPTYADSRNGYEQRVSKRGPVQQRGAGVALTKFVKNELTVRWLKPVQGAVQEETTEHYVCMDAATSNASTVALVNWCLPWNHPELRAIEAKIRSLKLN